MKNPWLIGLVVMFLFACQQDPCRDISCLNGGICLDGFCDCPEGFIGPDCGIELDPCQQLNCVVATTDSCLRFSSTEAKCMCRFGFEGDRCEDSWEDKYEGGFSAGESCNGTVIGFNMQVDRGPDPQQITFSNFHNQTGIGTRVVGKLISSNIISIEQQFMTFGQVSGAGSIDADGNIQLTYAIITSNDSLQCSALLEPN
ncbi:MAG: hypothetical protein AAF206_02550 [Bacteroidota bacterium]